MCLDSTYSDLKTLGQVSLYLRLSDLEMNRTSSLLVRSDKLVIVSHLPLAPVNTVVMPAEYEFVRHRSPIPVASRCFPLSHRLKAETTGCRTKAWHDPRVQWSDRLRWSACSPGRQQSGYVVIPQKCHAEGAVDRGSVLQIAGPKKGGEGVPVHECCKVWDMARRGWNVLCGTKRCTPILSHACAWYDCTHWRAICATTVHEKMWRAEGVFCLQHYCLFSASKFHDSKHWCLWR